MRFFLCDAAPVNWIKRSPVRLTDGGTVFGAIERRGARPATVMLLLIASDIGVNWSV